MEDVTSFRSVFGNTLSSHSSFDVQKHRTLNNRGLSYIHIVMFVCSLLMIIDDVPDAFLGAGGTKTIENHSRHSD